MFNENDEKSFVHKESATSYGHGRKGPNTIPLNISRRVHLPDNDSLKVACSTLRVRRDVYFFVM